MRTCTRSIPQTLRERPQWVLHRDKVPHQPSNPQRTADKTNPEHWSDFGTAVETARKNDEIDGLGFVVTERDNVVGLDLDHCRDPETGELDDEARQIVTEVDTYFEISPSGTGLRGFALGRLPDGRRRRDEVEMYDSAWYFTVTGKKLDGTPENVKKRQGALRAVHEEYLAEEPSSQSDRQQCEEVYLSDDELLERIRDSAQGDKFEDLWQGDWSRHPSQSEADLALCSILAFWTRRDAERIDQLFRRSELYREKWEREDYRDRTIKKAIKNCTEVFEPSKEVTRGGQGDATESTDAKNEALGGSGAGGPKQADRLLELASGAALFQTPEGKAYVSFEVDEHRETWPITSDRFTMHLMRLHKEVEGKTPSREALNDARDMMKAEALFEGKTQNVYTRVGRGHDGAIYIDLCDEEWRAVRVTGEGWSIVNRPQIYFRRSSSMRPLPIPDPEGNIGALRSFANVTHRGWCLVVAWLVAALRPEGPYPVLVLQGEQGSAKSTLARFLRRLIDPNGALLRTSSRNERDLIISASNSHVIAYDNVSKLPNWLSDALCRLSTGGGFATRELYTDRGEEVFDEIRPAIIASIEDVVTRGDLADRAIRLTLSSIPEEERTTERKLNAKFRSASPTILGGLLDALACAERRIDEVQLDHMPRMADFAEWIVAAEPALPWEKGAFMQAYEENRTLGVLDNLQMNPLASGVHELMEETDGNEWQGTPSELLNCLDKIVPESDQAAKAYPGGPSWVTRKLERVKPLLRRVGIEVQDDLRVNGQRRVRITADTNDTQNLGSVASVPSSQSEEPSVSESDFSANPDTEKPDDEIPF